MKIDKEETYTLTLTKQEKGVIEDALRAFKYDDYCKCWSFGDVSSLLYQLETEGE